MEETKNQTLLQKLEEHWLRLYLHNCIKYANPFHSQIIDLENFSNWLKVYFFHLYILMHVHGHKILLFLLTFFAGCIYENRCNNQPVYVFVQHLLMMA